MSFWDFTTEEPKIATRPKSGGMEFRVGEGLTPEQTKIAYEKIATPSGVKSSFWEQIKTEFSIRDEPVEIRKPFQLETEKTIAPPIVTQLGTLGFSLLEAIPRGIATLGGEFKAGFKPAEVKSNINLKRFGFETPNYVTASKKVQDKINSGENPWQAGLEIVSNTTLDVAFGAALISDLAKLSTSILLRGGVEARIEAQGIVDAYKVNQKEAFARLKNAPLEVREKAMADITNAKNQAEKVLAEQGKPTAIDRTRANTARYTEVIGRQTPIKKSFWSDIVKPDVSLKTPVSTAPVLETKQLPGTREVPGQAPAFGLSTKKVESVGRTEIKVGDVIDTQGKTNMKDPIKIREIVGNTLKFTDAEGTDFAGMARATARNLIEGGSWKKVEDVGKDLEPLAEEARKFSVFDKSKKLLGEVEAKDFYYAEDKAKELFKDKYSYLTKKPVGESINPLAIEARKYKSAEEFVNSQRLLRAGAETEKGKGLFGTDNLELAKLYQEDRGGKIQEIFYQKPSENQVYRSGSQFSAYVDLFPNSKKAEYIRTQWLNGKDTWLEKRDISYFDRKYDVWSADGKYNFVASLDKEIAKELQKRGVKLAEYTNTAEELPFLSVKGVKEYQIIDSSILKTKSQLTDFYNKAVGKPDIIKQALDARKAQLIRDGFTGFGLPEKPVPKELKLFEKSGALSEIDKLIAEGKVRVVSRDNRDIFQIKKGGEWKNARDEESAVKQLTQPKAPPKPKVYSEADRQKIEGTKAMLENVRERLAEHPAKPLLKFISKKEGQFEDFRNPNLAKNPKEAEKIRVKNKEIMKTAENAFQDNPELHDKFDNADTIKEVIADYQGQRQVEKSLVASKNDLEKTLKPISEKSPQQLLPKTSLLDTTTGKGIAIEIQAQQALSILESEPVGLDVSLPHIIENTVTNVKQKVHIVDTYLRSPEAVMQKIGFGKEYEMLNDAMQSYWKELPKNLDVITQWDKQISKEGNKNIFRFLDGEAITLPPVEKKVALEIRDWLKNWAVKLKLPADNTITYYITHIFDKELLKKEFDEDLAKIIADKIPGSVYDPFLLKRLGAKGYKQDTWAALDAYTKRATRKVHLDPVLDSIREKAGSSLELSNIEKSQWNYIKKYIDNINMRPSEAEEGIDNFVKSIIGYKFGQRPVITILKTLRQMTFRGMLGLNPTSALRNLSQGINTYSTLGEKYTAIGYVKLFSKGAGEEMAREGILNAGFVQDRGLSATKKAIEKMDKVLFAFFDTAEKINRGAAYFGAKSQGLSKGMSEDEAIKYAKDIVRKTQFIYDSVNTPVGMSSSLAKTLTQFQTFTTKQLEFLGTMAKDRNFAGLIRYALAGMAFVYTVGKTFGMEPKELLPWYRFDIPPSLKFPVESTKALLGTKDKYGNERTTKEKLSDVGKSAIGLIPAGSQIKKTTEGIMSVKEGGVFTKSGNLQFQQGQSLAEKVQAILFGKYASNEAKDYFNRGDIKTKEQEPIKKIYDEVHKLNDAGKTDEAQAIVDSLSDTDYEIYKDIRTSEKRANTIKAEQDMFKTVLKVKALSENGNMEEAQKIIDDMTDEEYRIYQLTKKKLK